MDMLLVYQEAPRCFGCCGPINDTPIFSSLCGHEGCPSTAWHYHHFMKAREVFDTYLLPS